MEVEPDGTREGLRAVSDNFVSSIAHAVRAEESRVVGSGSRNDLRNSGKDGAKNGN